jgi:hypothetical protein
VIAWCRGCNVTELPRPGVCWTCRFVESIRRPLDVEVLYGPRYEHNTVDLKALQKDRLARKYRGWGTR